MDRTPTFYSPPHPLPLPHPGSQDFSVATGWVIQLGTYMMCHLSAYQDQVLSTFWIRNQSQNLKRGLTFSCWERGLLCWYSLSKQSLYLKCLPSCMGGEKCMFTWSWDALLLNGQWCFEGHNAEHVSKPMEEWMEPNLWFQLNSWILRGLQATSYS